MLATLGDNVSANSLSAANNMTVLFPRYINVQHPPWAGDLCRPRRVGAVPLGDPGERAGVLVVHERVQRVFGYYGCGREHMRPICSLCCVVTDRIGGA